MAIQAVIFDLDGTIIDSMGTWENIDHSFFTNRDLSLTSDYLSAVKTMSFSKAARYTKARYDLPESEEEIMQEWMKVALVEYEKIKLKQGVREYLTWLNNNDIKIGLATTNIPPLIEIVLKNNDVSHLFSAITTGSEVSRDKSHPDIYLLTAQKLAVNPENCIVFEDTLVGVTGASKANMIVIGIYDAYSAKDKEQIQELATDYRYGFGQMVYNHQRYASLR